MFAWCDRLAALGLSAGAAALLFLTCAGAAPAQAAAPQAEPSLVIFDNDFFGAANTDVLPLTTDPRVRLLGFTVVTGDGWVDEETSGLLRFLEITHRADIPVVKGAVWPLINTPQRTLAWEAAFGKIPWKGAWNPAGPGASFHPEDPYLVPANPSGAPTITAASGTAAAFLIDQVHRHPHQVTILAAGPLTNIALAIRLDPQFASLAKELVFMGALVDVSLPQVTGNTNFNTDFNFIFDPEAAHITLTAPWARIVAIGNVSNDIAMTPALMARIAAKKTPVTELMARNIDSLPLWDQLAAAVVADPALITKSVEAYMDVDTSYGPFYGATRLWPEATRPPGLQKVQVVQAIDAPRFIEAFVKAAQAPIP